tara:strand:- start:463 stop:642 length:180 start_codon:yes stop_codon:yes gene_type:complete
MGCLLDPEGGVLIQWAVQKRGVVISVAKIFGAGPTQNQLNIASLAKKRFIVIIIDNIIL